MSSSRRCRVCGVVIHLEADICVECNLDLSNSGDNSVMKSGESSSLSIGEKSVVGNEIQNLFIFDNDKEKCPNCNNEIRSDSPKNLLLKCDIDECDEIFCYICESWYTSNLRSAVAFRGVIPPLCKMHFSEQKHKEKENKLKEISEKQKSEAIDNGPPSFDFIGWDWYFFWFALTFCGFIFILISWAGIEWGISVTPDRLFDPLSIFLFSIFGIIGIVAITFTIYCASWWITMIPISIRDWRYWKKEMKYWKILELERLLEETNSR